jgi:hypothetical protein
MAHAYYRFTIEIDGRRHVGHWYLQDGRINVESAWGSQTVDLGGEKPGLLAKVTLQQIVRAWRERHPVEHGAGELVQFPRRRKLAEKRLAEQAAAEIDPIREALQRLVEQIESSSYFDQHGHLLELDPAFIEARELLRGYTLGTRQ